MFGRNLILWILAVLGLGLFITSLLGLRDDPSIVRYEFVAEDAFRTPVLALQPRGWKGGPSAVVFHGYSGSKEMMQAIARSLARSGIAVYCPDLPGSGDSMSRYRRDEMFPAVRGIYSYLLAKGYIQPGTVALIGHAMGGSLAMQLAMETDGIQATISISNPPSLLQRDRPRNFLAVVGERDVPGLQDATVRMLSEATAGAVSQSDQETGSIIDGTARRLIVVGQANHLGVLYNPRTLRGIQEWLGRTFSLKSLPEPPRWTLWVGLFYSGIFLLFIPVAALMGTVRQPRVVLSFEHQAGWRNNLLCLPAALLALLVLRYWSPLEFIRIEGGGYLASFFLLTGLFRIILVRLTQSPDPGLDLDDLTPSIMIGVAAFLFLYLTFGAMTHRSWLYLLESAGRLRWLAVVAVGISPFFFEDEKAARSVQEDSSPWGSYFYSLGGKVFILAALLLAIGSPFFRAPRFLLSVSFPFLVLLFAVFQLFSVALYHFTRRTMTTAVFNTLLFAWLLTAPFVQV
ncbi:MAG TPA: alpha/beta fold hydrolase [Acidobacteriota bacterium]|nr:alpha/beta fold hydrolase [Acidobacteriota bacterium]